MLVPEDAKEAFGHGIPGEALEVWGDQLRCGGVRRSACVHLAIRSRSSRRRSPKRRVELVNPVKSLTGVIDRWGTGNEGQSYPYAPLSAGLDIVRSALCKHELAVIQTTYVDRDTSIVLLTTTLAHGSGEWICAIWPVRRTSEMTNPKLMGAALTYARRYGLFTLVGIAGEDDLDAPEVAGDPDQTASSDSLRQGHATGARPDAQANPPAPGAGPVERLGPALVSPYPAQASRCRRAPRAAPPGSLEVVLGELAAIEEPDELFQWPLRNTLPETMRSTLDAAFFEKAGEVGADPELLCALISAEPA